MKAVLFDFDGVVIRSMEDHYEGWRKALQEYGIEMNPRELYLMEGSAVEELAGQFTRKFNLPFEETSNIIRKKEIYYEQIKKIEFYPNLIEIFQWINEKELRTALVTGGSRDRVLLALSDFGLKKYFDVIVTADDVFYTKPAPEPFLRAAQSLQVEAEECMVIENAPLGIRSAKAAGMRCIAVTTTLPRMYLKQADVITDNLQQVLEILKRMY